MGEEHVGGNAAATGEASRLEALRRSDVIVRTAALALDVGTASIRIGDSTDCWILCSYGTDVARMPIDATLRGVAGSAADLFVVEDFQTDARFAKHGGAPGFSAMGFYGSYPLLDLNQQVFGVLCVMDEKPRRFDERYASLLRGFATWAQNELNAVERERFRLEAANSRLVAPAVHRMRGALTSIHGFSSFLLNQECAPEERHEVLGIIHDQASYLASVATELVELMHIDISEGRDLQLSRRNGAEVLREIVAACDAGPVSLHIEEGLPPISVDTEYFRRALSRLLGHARGDSKEGEGIDVSLARGTEPGYLVISVRHRYRESSPPEVDRIFEPFSPPYRDESNGAYPLGLALTKEIITLHGGKALVAEDRQRHCMEVRVLLPIKP